jgi:hypothetical protein
MYNCMIWYMYGKHKIAHYLSLFDILLLNEMFLDIIHLWRHFCSSTSFIFRNGQFKDRWYIADIFFKKNSDLLHLKSF